MSWSRSAPSGESPRQPEGSAFVDVELGGAEDEQPADVEPASGLYSLSSSYKRRPSRWQSHLALHTLGPREDKGAPRQRRNSLPSTAPNHPMVAGSGDSKLNEQSTMPNISTPRGPRSLGASTVEETPESRRVEGKYRSRRGMNQAIYNPSRSTVSLVSQLGTPQGARINTSSPGLSMTYADDDGELHMISSPHPPASPANEVHPDMLVNGAAVAAAESRGSPRTSQSVSQVKPLADAEPPQASKDASVNPTKDQDASAGNAGRSSTDTTSTTATPSASRTRMPHLPPKSRAEERRHLSAFNTMMREAKKAEKKKQDAERQAEKARAEQKEKTQRIWETEILSNWTRARHDKAYRNLWWDGVPSSLRPRLWPRACGNDIMLSQDLFPRALAVAQETIDAGEFAEKVLAAVDADIADTLPTLNLFQQHTGVLNNDLREVLLAFVCVRADEVSQRTQIPRREMERLAQTSALYVSGTASLAAMLVMNMTQSQALVALLNLIASKKWLHAIYQLDRQEESLSKQELAHERVFNTLLSEMLPSVYANLHKAGVRPSAFARQWIQTLYVPWLDVDTVSRLWDVLLLEEGDAMLFRIALALMKLLEPRLYVHDREELESVLQGNNPGALAVWRRSEGAEPSNTPPKDRIYAQYCISEHAMFAALSEQDQWWKDQTLHRLLDRELTE